MVNILDSLYNRLANPNQEPFPGRFLNLSKEKKSKRTTGVKCTRDNLEFNFGEYDKGLTLVLNIYSPTTFDEQALHREKRKLMIRIDDYLIRDPIMYKLDIITKRLENSGYNKKDIEKIFKPTELEGETILYPMKRKILLPEQLPLAVEHTTSPPRFLANEVVFTEILKEIRKLKSRRTSSQRKNRLSS